VHGWRGARTTNIISPPPKNQIPKAGGQKGRGSGGRNFCPPASPAKLDRNRRLLLRSRNPKQKNFHSFLIEFKIGAQYK